MAYSDTVSRTIAQWIHFLDRRSVRAIVTREMEHFTKVCTSKESHRVGELLVCGNEEFRTDVEAALSRLEQSYPYGHRLVQRYVRGVVASSDARKDAAVIGVCYQPTTSNGRLPWPSNRFAAVLFRHAVLARQLGRHALPRSRKRTLSTLRWELKAMERLNCHPSEVRPQLARIKVLEDRRPRGRAQKGLLLKEGPRTSRSPPLT